VASEHLPTEVLNVGKMHTGLTDITTVKSAHALLEPITFSVSIRSIILRAASPALQDHILQ
jgi:hypothetical protein